MKKKIFARCLMGAPIGLSICTVITILFSLIYGNGEYFAAPHDLIAECGSEIKAVILQTLLGSVYGAIWGGASVIWEMEDWSLLKTTLIHLCICSLASFPIAYLLQWMPCNLLGAGCFFGIFFVIYSFIWLSRYSSIKKQVEKMNSKLQEQHSDSRPSFAKKDI